MACFFSVHDAQTSPIQTRPIPRLHGTRNLVHHIDALEGAHLFGSVESSQVRLNSIGTVARDCWNQVPEHFSHVRRDSFVVMPSHLHALLALVAESIVGDHPRVEKFGAPVPGSVGTIIRSFKAATTKLAREQLGIPVRLWQPRYHARRIEDPQSLRRARKYIEDNPARWSESKPVRHKRTKHLWIAVE